MKNIFFLLLFLLINNCINKTAYWCGDHVCVNKKEKAAYFKETLSVEAVSVNKKDKNNKINNKITKTNFKKNNFKKVNKSNEKVGFHERFFEKKDKIKELKSTKNKIVKKTKPKKKEPIIKNVSENVKSNSVILNNTDKFDDFVNKVIKKNKNKPYRNINDIPD